MFSRVVTAHIFYFIYLFILVFITGSMFHRASHHHHHHHPARHVDSRSSSAHHLLREALATRRTSFECSSFPKEEKIDGEPTTVHCGGPTAKDPHTRSPLLLFYIRWLAAADVVGRWAEAL